MQSSQNIGRMVYDVNQANCFREMMEYSAKHFADKTAFLVKKDNGEIQEITYQEFYLQIKQLSAYLNSLGLEYKRIAVIGKNCYGWALSYLAIGCGTGVIVPVDKELKSHDIKNILEMSESSAVIYENSLKDTIDQIDLDIIKLSMHGIEEFLRLGQQYDEQNNSYCRHIVNPYEMGVLLYTSGTTGAAKGVMLSQYNICFDIYNVKKRVHVDCNDRVMSVLPLHHTYECTAGFLAMIYSGASISYLTSLRTVAQDFALYKPTIFITVPLLLENIHANILKKFAAIKGGMAVYTVGMGITRAADILGIDLSDKFFGQIHSFFGGKLKTILIGAAALSPTIFNDFKSFGFNMYNGYGLTETSPVCIMHDDFMKREADNVGKPLNGGMAKIFEPNENGVGEIIYKGDNVMLGYYNNQAETDKVIVDGWFHTGDMGFVDKNGYFHLQGRIKSMIVLPNGKKVFPEEMEILLSKKEYIKEAMVVGRESNGEVIVCAKIFPDYEKANKHLLNKGIDKENANYDKEIKELITKQVKEVNRLLPGYKAIKSVEIRKTEFDKTTTKKIKRYNQDNDNNK